MERNPWFHPSGVGLDVIESRYSVANLKLIFIRIVYGLEYHSA
jgi:hypothetical protein